MDRFLVYKLLLGWHAAWEKHSSQLKVSALPGSVLAAAAGAFGVPFDYDKIIQKLDHDPLFHRGKYLQSKLRNEINLALFQAQKAGWLTKVPLPQGKNPVQYYEHIQDQFFYRLWGSIEEKRVREILQDHGGPDNWFWHITVQGQEKAEEISKMVSELQKGPIGFVKY